MNTYYEFEWNETKNVSNLKKHGISLTDARVIWDDPMFVQVRLATTDEERWAAIGRVAKSLYWTAIFTFRGDRIRLISARKSTNKEVDVYGRG